MEKKVQVLVKIREIDNKNSIWSCTDNELSYIKQDKRIAYECFKLLYCEQSLINLYKNYVNPLVIRFNEGENVTIFAYGQTGSGKTYTMLGEQRDGVVQMAFGDILPSKVTLSFFEIYNERIYDLYTKQELKLYSINNITKIDKLHAEMIESYEDAADFLDICLANRQVGITEHNERSSRSHGVLQIRKEGSILNFIDLAGSERASRYESRKKEGSYINRSLLALGTLVNNLLKGHYIGFRDSKLTRILQESMDGGTNLLAMTMISPFASCLEESLSTLNFAARMNNLVLKKVESVIKKTVETEVSKNIRRVKLVKRPSKMIENDDYSENLFDSELKEELKLKMQEGNRIDFYEMFTVLDEQRKSESYLQVLMARISDLEKMIEALLDKNPNPKMKEIYTLEKRMFHLRKELAKEEGI